MAWQDVRVEIEFYAGSWTDVTSRVWSASGGRGRSYELATPNSGQMTFVIDNSDGALTPENAASPFYPEVKLFKRIRLVVAHNTFEKTLWTGYIESYPLEYMVEGGHFETIPLVATDTLGALNRVTLPRVYEAFVRNMKPTRYWPLTDRSERGEYFCQVTGKVARELHYGGDPKVSTVESPILGDEEASIPYFDPSRAGAPNNDTPPENFSIIRLTHGAGAEITNFHTGAWSFVISFFVPPSTLPIGDCVLVNICDSNATQANYIQIRAGTALNNSLLIHLNDFIVNAGAGRTIDTGRRIDDGFPHTVYFEMSSSAENSWKWSFDGSTFTTQAADNFDFNDIATRGTMDIGASWPVSNITHSQPYRGFASNLAVFDRVLTQTEVTNMANLANGGLLLQSIDTRIDWILRTANRSSLLGTYVPSTPGSVSLQGSHAGGKTAAQAIADVNSWELGATYINGDGLVVPVPRHARSNPIPEFNIGVGVSGGTVYPASGIEFEFDATHLTNDATVTVNDAGTVRAFDQASIDANGLIAVSETIETVDESDALARAQYLVSTYGTPRLRIKTITLEPSSNPELWDLVTQLELNDCVRIEHAPLAGTAVSNKLCFVESFDFSVSGEGFVVKMELSPAVIENWLTLNDTTKGVTGASANNKLSY